MVTTLLQVIQFHCHRARNYHQYMVYYIAILICFLRYWFVNVTSMKAIGWELVGCHVVTLVCMFMFTR